MSNYHTIGMFNRVREEVLSGYITTLGMEMRGVLILPHDTPEGRNPPQYKLLKDGCEIGLAWTRRARLGNEYLTVMLDSPVLQRPVYAVLFPDGNGWYRLSWRRQGTREDGESASEPAAPDLGVGATGEV